MEKTSQGRRAGNKVPSAIRKQIGNSHKKPCPICNCTMVYTPDKGTNCGDNEATWEHVLELSLGGSNTLENTSVICHACNSSLNSVLHIYLGVDNASFGSPKWKEIFVEDKINLVKLHRYLEWKMNAIFQGKTDGNEHLSTIWKKSRFREGKSANYDEGKRSFDSSERRGWVRGMLRRIRFFFSVKNRMSSESKPGLGQLHGWSDLDKENEVDLLNLLVSLIGDESVTAVDLGKRISAYQRDNDLEKTGTKALLASFGFNNTSLPKLIHAKFSERISAEVAGYGVSATGRRQPSNYVYSVITKPHVDSKTPEQPHLERAQKKIRAIGEDLSEQLRIKNMEIFSLGSAPNPHELPKWSDLDMENEVDLLNLLVSLIGEETVNGYELAKKIKTYQLDNDLEKTGTRELIASFGFRDVSLPKLIHAKFPERISAEVIGYGVNAAGRRQASNYAYSVKK